MRSRFKMQERRTEFFYCFVFTVILKIHDFIARTLFCFYLISVGNSHGTNYAELYIPALGGDGPCWSSLFRA